MRPLATAGAFVALLLCGAVAQAAEIIDRAFMVQLQDWREDGSDILTLDTTDVPYLPNSACYFWRLRVADRGLLRFREVLRLPDAPDFIEGEDDPNATLEVSADRRSLTTERFATPDAEGWLEHGWCLAEGDPLGDHRFEVTLDDGPAQIFDFEVVDP